MRGRASGIPFGGACVFQLPPDPQSAGLARTLLTSTMAELDLPSDLIEVGELAVSELATNAYEHAQAFDPYGLITPPELCVWARTSPARQLVISVFDVDRDHMPHSACTGLMDEHGRGLGIVASVSAAWGAHRSRCRLGPWPVSGKSVWFALPLHGAWPEPPRNIVPSDAAHRLLLVLGTRGIAGTQRSDRAGISVVTVRNLTVLVEPKSFSWNDGVRGHVRLPIIDLQETAERVVQQLEETAGQPAD